MIAFDWDNAGGRGGAKSLRRRNPAPRAAVS